jgi:uncharacterized protein (TIGR03382 family)
MPDAALPDAALPDAAPVAPDAAPVLDAAPVADAAPDAAPDAGDAPDAGKPGVALTQGEGGCAAAGTGPADLLALALLALVRRRAR